MSGPYGTGGYGGSGDPPGEEGAGISLPDSNETVTGVVPVHGPLGEVIYGMPWTGAAQGQALSQTTSSIRSTVFDYDTMRVSWVLPTANPYWDRFIVVRSTVAPPTSVDEGQIVLDLQRDTGITNILDGVDDARSVGYGLFLRSNGVWYPVARSSFRSVVHDRGMRQRLRETVPGQHFPNDDLERYLDLYAFEFDRMHSTLDAVRDKHDPFVAPSGYVAEILRQGGHSSAAGLGGRRARSFLYKRPVERYRKGTEASLEAITQALAGTETDVIVGTNVMHDRDHSRFFGGIGNWEAVGGTDTVVWSGLSPTPAPRELGGILKLTSVSAVDPVEAKVGPDYRSGVVVVAPGTTYTLSGYARSDAAARVASLRIDWYDRDGTQVTPVPGVDAGPGPFGTTTYGTANDTIVEHGTDPVVEHTATGAAAATVATVTTNNTAWQRMTYTIAAPAGAAYAVPVFSVANPAALESFYLDDVQLEVASAATDFVEPRALAVEVQPQRVNLIKNPAVNDDLLFWAAFEGALSQESTTVWLGDRSGCWTATTANSYLWTLADLPSGTGYGYFSMYLRLDPSVHTANESVSGFLRLEWLDSDRSVLSTDDGIEIDIISERWRRPSVLGEAPDGAVQLRCSVQSSNLDPTDAILFDGALLEDTPHLRTYFSGDQEGDAYWSGEAGRSPSYYIPNRVTMLNRVSLELLQWLPGDRIASIAGRVEEYTALVGNPNVGILPEGCLAAWASHSPFGPVLVDITGNARHAISSGSFRGQWLDHTSDDFVWLPGQSGNYVDVDNTHAEAVNDALVAAQEAWVAVEFESDVSGPGAYLFDGYGATSGVALRILGDDTVNVLLGDGVASNGTTTTATITPTDRQWVAVGWDGATATFYTSATGDDGDWAEIESGQAVSPTLADPGGNFGIGGASSGQFPGNIYAARIGTNSDPASASTGWVSRWDASEQVTAGEYGTTAYTGTEISGSGTGTPSWQMLRDTSGNGYGSTLVTRDTTLLDGVDDYFSVDTSAGWADFGVNDDWTLLAAYRSHSRTAGAIVVDAKRATSTEEGFLLHERTDGRILGAFGDGAAQHTDFLASGSRITAASDLSRVAVVRDGVAETLEVSENGVSDGPTSRVAGSSYSPVDDAIVFGATSDLAAYDELEFFGAALFNRVLTQSEIEAAQQYILGL